MILALALAALADALQILLLPVAWTGAQALVDVVAMILTTLLLGFHVLLLPTFVVEVVPVAGALPTWTACVAAVIGLRKRSQHRHPPIKQGKPPIHR